MIDPYELETRYGGKLDNLNEYWPPKLVPKFSPEKLSEETSLYYSVVNDFVYFEEHQQPSCSCS